MNALRRLTPLLAWAVFTLSSLAAEPAPAAPPETKSVESPWVFSLLPKSFQKNPLLELTVITETTEAGKKLPPVSPQRPAYYLAQSAGYRALGHAPGHEQSLNAEQVEQLLTRALATNGYLASTTPAHRPSLVIIYTWGSHNLLVEGDDENPTLSADLVARNLLDRAALVGGEKFAKEMLELFKQADAMALANPPARIDPAGLVPGIEPILGPGQMAFMNPVHQFKLRSAKNEFLVDQTAGSVYYVVASAYDHDALLKKVRKLLWRTRLTVAADGVSQVQTLPTLIATGGPFFGKEMAEPEILSKRPIRAGTVEVGVPAVVGPTPPLPPKKSK